MSNRQQECGCHSRHQAAIPEVDLHDDANTHVVFTDLLSSDLIAAITSASDFPSAHSLSAAVSFFICSGSRPLPIAWQIPSKISSACPGTG